MKKKRENIEVIYEHVANEYSEERLTTVYLMLFDEIQILIAQNKLNNKSYERST